MTEVKRGKTSDGQVRQGFACMFVFFSLYILHEITGRGGGGGGFFCGLFLRGVVILRWVCGG